MENISQTASIEELTSQVALLNAQLACLSKDNDSLSREVADLSREYADLAKAQIAQDAGLSKLKGENKYLRTEYDRVVELLKIANARHFGAKSEKIHPFQISLFNDMEAAFKDDTPEPAAEQIAENSKPRKKKTVVDWSRFDVEVFDHTLDATDRICPACEGPLAEMGMQIKRVFRIIPARVIVEEHRSHTYVCQKCSKANELDGGQTKVQIKRAQMHATTPLAGSCAHASLIADVLYRKYQLGLPLYRIANDYKNTMSLNLSRQTLAGWVIKTYERWLCLVYALMKEKLLGLDILQCDETRVQVLKEPKRKPTSQSYMWMLCSAECDIPLYLFQYSETREYSVVQNLLKGWSGYVIADGYQAYDNLGNKIVRISCLVHIQRQFKDILKGIDEGKLARAPGLASTQAIQMINEMFHIDNSFNDLDAKTRYKKRLEVLKPKMDAFYQWCLARRDEAVPAMKLHLALQYAINQWPSLENALSDGRLPLENNRAERAQRPFVVGRKAWLFSDTPQGAEASAGIYSIVTTARGNGLEPRAYLEWLLDNMSNTKDIEKASVLERFMPWSKEVPESCRLRSDEERQNNPLAEPIVDIEPSLLNPQD